jgi:hypothetical protein
MSVKRSMELTPEPQKNTTTTDDVTTRKRFLADLSLSSESSKNDAAIGSKSNNNSQHQQPARSRSFVMKPTNINFPPLQTPRLTSMENLHLPNETNTRTSRKILPPANANSTAGTQHKSKKNKK